MVDVAIDLKTLDIAFENGDIKTDSSIQSDVVSQILTTRRLRDYENPNLVYQGGWVGQTLFEGDFIYGSHFENKSLHAKIGGDIENELTDAIVQGLQNMEDEGKIISVKTEFFYENDVMNLLLYLVLPNNQYLNVQLALKDN